MRHLDTHTLWIQQAVRSKRVDLRKVRGEENPADLLTKHSSSRAKLEYLVSLFGCRYCDGRPAAAPLLRSGESSKVTLAQAAGDVRAVMSGNAEDICHVPQHDPATGNATLETARRTATVSRGTVEDAGGPSGGRETSPTMPHLDFSEEDLERLHPRILAPPEEPMHDLLKDEHDAVFQHGLKLAEEIQEQTDELGRRRSPEAPDGQTRVGMRRRPTRQSRGHLPPGRGHLRSSRGVRFQSDNGDVNGNVGEVNGLFRDVPHTDPGRRGLERGLQSDHPSRTLGADLVHGCSYLDGAYDFELGAQAALRCGPAWPSAEAARRRSAKGSTFAEHSYQLDCL